MNLKTKVYLAVPVIGSLVVIILFSFLSSDFKVEGEVERNSRLSPALEFKLSNGRQTSLNDLKGKPVLLNFWATWCQPCLDEMPSLHALEKHFGSHKLVVLAVNIQETPRAELQEKLAGITLPQNLLFDVKRSQISAYKIEGLPYSVLISQTGERLKSFEGPRAWESPAMIREIEQLIQ